MWHDARCPAHLGCSADIGRVCRMRWYGCVVREGLRFMRSVCVKCDRSRFVQRYASRRIDEFRGRPTETYRGDLTVALAKEFSQ